MVRADGHGAIGYHRRTLCCVCTDSNRSEQRRRQNANADAHRVPAGPTADSTASSAASAGIHRGICLSGGYSFVDQPVRAMQGTPGTLKCRATSQSIKPRMRNARCQHKLTVSDFETAAIQFRTSFLILNSLFLWNLWSTICRSYVVSTTFND